MRLIKLSIVLITPLIAGSAVPPCLIATIKVFSKFGALEERSYYEIIYLQILKILREAALMDSGARSFWWGGDALSQL